jgi:hypothetical protein
MSVDELSAALAAWVYEHFVRRTGFLDQPLMQKGDLEETSRAKAIS